MTSGPSSELIIVGNRPEPWDELCKFMLGFGVRLKHEAPGLGFSAKKVLAFQAPVGKNITEIKAMSQYHSIICEGLFAESSWALLAELLKDIANQKFDSLGELLHSPETAKAIPVKSAKERHALKDQMVEYLKGLKIRSTITDRCYQVAEEMLMNAIYDAPMDKSGKSLFNHMSRKDDILLSPEQYSTLEYATKNQIVAVSVTDPFGGLTRSVLMEYLESCYTGTAGEMNEKMGKGGAGRGLHQIVENSDLTVFQVKRGEKTRVVSYFWQRQNPFGENPQLSFTYFD